MVSSNSPTIRRVSRTPMTGAVVSSSISSQPGTYLRKNSRYSTASLRPNIIPSDSDRQLEPVEIEDVPAVELRAVLADLVHARHEAVGLGEVAVRDGLLQLLLGEGLDLVDAAPILAIGRIVQFTPANSEHSVLGATASMSRRITLQAAPQRSDKRGVAGARR